MKTLVFYSVFDKDNKFLATSYNPVEAFWMAKYIDGRYELTTIYFDEYGQISLTPIS